MNQIISELAKIYPQLYLNQDTVPKDRYREVVLQGAEPEPVSLSWYRTDARDRDENVDTPVGKVRVLTFYKRSDFEYFLRSMMAVKDGPCTEIPRSQGAATLVAFNWPRIRAHKQQFLKDQHEAGILAPDWDSEWKRFSSVKENYQDLLVVLSVGPYSAIEASEIGCGPEKWLELSQIIRKYHELTHVICRKIYPDRISAVWDELVADAIGLYAAYGFYDSSKAKLFLGIQNGVFVHGRLDNYTASPEELTPQILRALDGIEQMIRDHQGEEPFALIPFLESLQDEFQL